MAEGEEKKEKKTKAEASKPSWIKMKSEELEKIVVDLANEGKSPAEIGLILRDKHGVPKARLLGKKISAILEEKGINYRSDKQMVEKNVEKLKSHIGKNKHDYGASRALTKKLWAIQRM